jgi:hypothetical protein
MICQLLLQPAWLLLVVMMRSAAAHLRICVMA